jgi:branched-chain amino acid transport system permease protein
VSIVPQLLMNSLITGSMYALAAAGLAVSFGLVGVLNFAHGHLMMVGAYLLLFGLTTLGLGYPGAIVFALLATVPLMMGFQRFFITPFSRFGPSLAFVATVGLGGVLEAVVSILFGVSVRSLPAPFTGTSIEFWGVYVTPTQILTIVVALMLLAALASVLHHSPLGRSIRAISLDPHAAEGLGLPQARITALLYCLAGLTATAAGMLIGLETNLQPTMGTTYTVKGFAAVLLGGRGNLWGTVAGSYLLGTIENFVVGIDLFGYSVPSSYKDAISFLLILTILLVRPEGLFSAWRRKV